SLHDELSAQVQPFDLVDYFRLEVFFNRRHRRWPFLRKLRHLWLFYLFEQPQDHVFGRHPFSLRLEIRAEAMPQYGHGDFLDVVDGDAEAAVHGSEGFAAVDQELAGAGAGAPIDQLFDKLGSGDILGPRRADETGNVFDDVLADGDGVDQLLQVDDRPRGENLADFDLFRAGCLSKDLFFFVGRGIADLDIEHEPVELGFWQRVRALLLDRILRGDYEEGI